MLCPGRTLLLACLLAACTANLPGQTANHPCLPCHPSEVERFTNSPMGQSLSASFNEPPGHFNHKASGASVTISRDGRGMYHKVEEHGLAADYPIKYSIGYGKVGRSYLIDLNGNLFQSPASFYTAKPEWSVSPGYETAHLLDFTRSITADCLSCHAGSIQKLQGAVRLTALSCDRCHGPSDQHLKKPVPGSIINPAKLSLRERDSVCEQCHLEGATTVLNAGRTWSDFHPGMPLEAIETHYVYRNRDGSLSSMAAVSQAEQLAVSACLRNSSGKLWCGTCHDPHGPKVADRSAQIRQICSGCHSPTQLAGVHSPGQDDCVACHMPQRPASDITHAAVTDHRILRRPGVGQAVSAAGNSGQILAVWQSPADAIAQRNLGLAWFHIARQNNSGPDFERAFEILSRQPHAKDAEALAAMGYMLLGTGRTQDSIRFFESAIDCQPYNSEYWLDIGVAQQSSGNSPEAIRSFSRAIDLAPYDYRSYKALSDLYKRSSQPELAHQVLKRFLGLVPQSLTVRLLQ